MSLSGALTVALTGLQTSSAVAQLISGNVANAQTTGYTEKTANLDAISTGSTLGGVEVSGYSRVTDSVLSATLNAATSTASYLSTQSGYLSQVQSILDSTDDPPALSNDLSNFQAAWTQYAADPSDTTLEQSVVSTGQTLAATVNSIASQTSTLQTNVQDDLSTTVTSLNTALAKIQQLNTEITTAMNNGQPAVDLEDERDEAVNQVAQYTNVSVLQRPSGQIAVYTSSGTPLVDGQAQVFSVSSDGNSVVNAAGANVDGSLTGGSLQAQTDFLSTTNSSGNGVGVISKITSQLQNFANMFVSTASGGFANTYNDATTASGEQPSSFFTGSIDSDGLPDLASFAVNANLVDGTKTVKVASATPVANTFTATNLAITTTENVPATNPATYSYATSSTFTATGLNTSNQTYSGVVTAILSGFQQAANNVKNQSSTATTQQAYYQSSLSSETGVNTDTELVNLTNWENSYAASAHVISTIQSMMQTLDSLVQ